MAENLMGMGVVCSAGGNQKRSLSCFTRCLEGSLNRIRNPLLGCWLLLAYRYARTFGWEKCKKGMAFI